MIDNFIENDENLLKYAVDIPKHPMYDGEMENIDYFETKEEALKFCQKHFGADEEGKISLISELNYE